MSNVDPISNVSSSSANQQLIAALRAQMMLYAPGSSGSSEAKADYQALQSAILKGDAVSAQSDLDHLKQDATAPTAPAAPSDSSNGLEGNAGAEPPGAENSINTTA